MTRQRALLVVAGLMLLSAALRTSIAFEGGIWRDEALFLGVVGLPSWTEMLAYLRHHESHPPLYYALTRVWLAITGTSDASALALSIIFGVLLVPAVYAFGTRIFGQRAGLVAASFITIVPSVNEDGSTARPYALLTLAVLASVYLLMTAMESGKLMRWVAHGASAVVLVYIHNWGWLVVAGMVAATAVHAVRVRVGPNPIRGLLVSLGVTVIAYLPWAGAFLSQAQLAGHSGIPVDGLSGSLWLAGYAVLTSLNATMLPPSGSMRWILAVAALVASVILIWAQFAAPEKDDGATFAAHQSRRQAVLEMMIIVIVSVGSATVVSPWTNLLVGRCLSVLTPILVLPLAAAAVSLTHGAGFFRRRAIVAAVAVTLGGLYTTVLVDLVTQPRSNAREVANEVSPRYRSGDLLIIIPGWLESSFNHYATVPMNQIAYPDSGGTRLFDFSGLWRRMQDTARLAAVREKIDEAGRSNSRVWLITDAVSYRTASDVEKQMASGEVAWAMSKIRTGELRESLVRTFGPPAWSASRAEPLPRQETFIAELFQR